MVYFSVEKWNFQCHEVVALKFGFQHQVLVLQLLILVVP